jgi:hypothetical protein
MKYVFALSLLASSLAYGAAPCSPIPVGAQALGYTTEVFYDKPSITEVSTADADTTSRWYPGTFSHTVTANLATRELLLGSSSGLALQLMGEVSSETQSSTAGVLPFLSGATGFYVEFTMRLSSNDPDHHTGLYLLPMEHNLAKTDHLSTDPAGFERWTEIDVSEAGYGPGSLATVINWQGEYPHYTPTIMNNSGHQAALDFTVEHRYGVSYDPATNTLQWYVDDEPTWKIVPPNSLIKDWHYYLVMSASTHGAYVPYEMYISAVTAWAK